MLRGGGGWSPTVIFALNFIAITPLAAVLSFATEISIPLGDTLGGLLNATFGNAVELIVSIIALKKGEIEVVQSSILGSILSNLLLVMGMSFLLGGMVNMTDSMDNGIEQSFTSAAAQTTCSLLALSSASMIVPATVRCVPGREISNTPLCCKSRRLPSGKLTNSQLYSIPDRTDEPDKIQIIVTHSRGTAILLLLLYILYLCFQLRTHRNPLNVEAGVAPGLEDEASDELQTTINPWAAATILIAVTIIISFCADYLVGSIDTIAENIQTSKSFIGLILIPIVGNAAEHATACVMAVRNKMDLVSVKMFIFLIALAD